MNIDILWPDCILPRWDVGLKNWTLDKRVPLPFKTILKNNNLLLEFVRLGSVFQ